VTGTLDTDPYVLPGGWRRRPEPVSLPLKPGRAACMVCTWRPWRDPQAEAAQHAHETRHPTIYRPAYEDEMGARR